MTERWYPAYVGIGSNLDTPVRQVQDAFESLASIAKSRLILASSLYRSAPLGPADQPDYVNAVVALMTQLVPDDFLTELQDIENSAGRKRAERWGPRVLDLDLLAWSNREVDTETLTLPHPRIAERNFVLLPWREITPYVQVAGIGTVEQLAQCAPAEPCIEQLN